MSTSMQDLRAVMEAADAGTGPADRLELIRRRVTEKQLSFKRALNQAVRDGAAGRPAVARFATRTADLWVPSVTGPSHRFDGPLSK